MIYTPEEKTIYTSPLGGKYDPLEVCHLLILHSQGKWNDWLDAFYGSESEVDRAAAALQLVSVGRKVFGLKPLVDDGYGDGFVLEVIDHYMEYVAKKP